MKKPEAEKRLQFLIDTEEALFSGPSYFNQDYEFMQMNPDKFNRNHPNFSEVQELLKIIVRG
jgi:hypothetical protein